MLLDLTDLRPRLAASLSDVNWPAMIVTLALEGVFLAMLLSLGVGSMLKPREEMKVLQLLPNREPPAAPAPPAEPEKQVEQVVQPQPRTEIIVPPPKVVIPTVSQPVVAAIAPPTPPAPVAASTPKPAPAAPSAGSGPVSVANLNTNLLSGAPPAYPMGARRKREQGTVVLRLVIGEDGRVVDVTVQRSSGFAALDQAAVGAVRKWRWSPTVRDGRPIPITGLVQIPFVLKDG
jgi:protein TonB